MDERKDLHRIPIARSAAGTLDRLEVELGVTAHLHGNLQAAGECRAFDGLIGEVLELVEQNLAMDHHKALHQISLQRSVTVD